MAGKKESIALIFMVMLLDVMGFSILLPIAPFAVARYSHDAIMVTLVSFFFALAAFVSAPILGTLGDRFGRRPVILFCMVGSAIGYMLFGIGGALWVLFLARIVEGIAGGCISTASAYLIDISAPEERAKNMGLIGMAYGIGFIMGPALGGALGQVSINAPVFAIAAMSLLGAALIHFRLPESLAPEHREPAALTLREFNPFGSIVTYLAKPGLGSILVVFALFNLYFSGTGSVRALFLVHRYNVEPMQIGALFVASGIATAIVQVALMGRLIARFGEKAMAITGLAGLTLGGLCFVLLPRFWMQFPLAFVQSGVSSFIWSTLGSLAAAQVSRREQGALSGVNAAIGGLMAAIGPLLAGAAYDHAGMSTSFTWGAIIPMLAIVGVAWKVKKNGK